MTERGLRKARSLVEQIGPGKIESQPWDVLCSAQWDHPDDVGLRARYAVFSAQRSGSGWLCDHLRQCGLGVPFEYFNPTFALRIGDRLGCIENGNFLYVERYIERLERLRARHGIFGTKLQPNQLRSISDQSDARAIALLRRFDKLILLRRRDRLLQAISLTRAHLTKQWHLYGDDPARIIEASDAVLFPMVRDRLAKIAEDERYMTELVSKLDPRAVRMLWYEELAEPPALESVAEWLWNALGGGAPRPAADRSLPLARKMDEAEARAIKARYLAVAGAASEARPAEPDGSLDDGFPPQPAAAAPLRRGRAGAAAPEALAHPPQRHDLPGAGTGISVGLDRAGAEMIERRHSFKKTGAGHNEILHRDALCSEQWDRPDEVGLRARYAVFSAQRTGSEWLCDYLRQCAIGVPFEYYNHGFMLQIADRLGCSLPGNFVFFRRYMSMLEPLRARHGIFGTKLQPDQLRTITAESDDRAVTMLRRFDRLVLLGRRDKFLQAISLARAHLTNQWQLYGGDDPVRLTVGDDVLFPMISERLSRVVNDDRYMSELVSGLDPDTVRLIWYEDLAEPGALEGVAQWLWDALGGGAPRPEPDRGLALAHKMDEAEAQAIKRRYLAFIEAGGDSKLDRPP